MTVFEFDPRASASETFASPLGELFHAEYAASVRETPDSMEIELVQRLVADADVVLEQYATRSFLQSLSITGRPNLIPDPSVVLVAGPAPMESSGTVHVRAYGAGEPICAERSHSYTVAKSHSIGDLTIYVQTTINGKTGLSAPRETYYKTDYDASDGGYSRIRVEVPAKDSYTISFDANGGDQAQCPDAMVKWHDEEAPFPEGAMESGEGVFVGWSIEPDGAVTYPTNSIPASFNHDATFYAVWDNGRYLLVLDPNGADGEAVERGCEVGEYYALGECPFTREGYDFLGWSQSADGPAEFADNGTFTMPDTGYSPKATLYAVWRRDPPAITSMEADRMDEGAGTAAISFDLYRSMDGYEPDVTAHLTLKERSGGGVLHYEIDGISSGEAFEIPGISKASYDLEAYIDDGFMRSDTFHMILAIGTGSYTLDFAAGGRGIGVFRKCPEEGDGLFLDGTLTYNGVLLEDLFKAAILASHPIGSYYWSDEPTDPGTIFGGSWKAVTDRFVYAAGELGPGDIGGAKDVRLTAEQSGSPAHRHPVDALNTGGASADHTHSMQGHTHTSANKLLGTTGTFYRMSGCVKTATATGYSAVHSFVYNDTDGSTGTKVTGGPSVASTGGQSATHAHQVPAHETGYSSGGDASQAHDNMPPFIVAYCWRRVA